MPDFSFPSSPAVVAQDIGASPSAEIKSASPVPPPAAVIGTTNRGPAMVPFDIVDEGDYIRVFGPIDGRKMGPISARQWFNNDGASVVYVRPLGAGDCEPRLTTGNNDGRVLNAGFVTGQEIINTGTNEVGPNTYAYSPTPTVAGQLGRTYFLATLMSQSKDSTIFSDAGLQTLGKEGSRAILRGVLFAPSGVVLSLKNTLETNNTPTSDSPAIGSFGSSQDGGAPIGTVTISDAKQEFTLLLNGHKNTNTYPSTIKTSFDPEATQIINDNVPNPVYENSYFVEKFNTDPTKIQEAGHYLYAHYDIPITFANITGTDRISSSGPGASDWAGIEPIAFLVTASLNRNFGSSTSVPNDVIGVPNFENFEDRFSAGFSPFVISQTVEGKKNNLFRFRTHTDGYSALNEVKITIKNIRPPAPSAEKNIFDRSFCQFDIDIRNAFDTDDSPTILETVQNCSLNPTSENYIAKLIGDMNSFYDFDASRDGRKIVVTGDYPNKNQYVSVEMAPNVLDLNFLDKVIPCGFRGIYHLVTSGTTATPGAILTGSMSSESLSVDTGLHTATFQSIVQPPLPFREHMALKSESTPLLSLPKDLAEYGYYTWGVQYETKQKPKQPNGSSQINSSLFSQLKFFPSFQITSQNVWVGNNELTTDVGGCILDADRFNNNLFTIENILVITGSSKDGRDLKLPDLEQFAAAIYARNGKNPRILYDKVGSASDKVRFLDPDFDLKDASGTGGVRKFIKFTLPIMGGYDGLNIFDLEKTNMTNEAIRRENTDSGQYGKKDSTTAAYLKTIDILAEKQSSDPQLIVVPGIRQQQVTDYAIEMAESRFDALCLIDLEKFDEFNLPVTGTEQDVNLQQSVSNFRARQVGSSFAAAYFPDVFINLPNPNELKENKFLSVQVPPSVGALGVMALNDKEKGTYSAPMGPVRGKISQASSLELPHIESIGVEKAIKNNVNLIRAMKAKGIIISAQKTCLGKQTVLDRINTRRLMIDIRRQTRDIARAYLFEPAKISTMLCFKSDVQFLLNSIKVYGGIEDFKVIVDEKEFLKRQVPDSGVNWPAALDGSQSGLDEQSGIIRAKVLIRPVESDEMIVLDIEEPIE